MKNEKKAELPPRVWLLSDKQEEPEHWQLGDKFHVFLSTRGMTMEYEYLSLAEHQSLLTAAEEKQRIAREAMVKASIPREKLHCTSKSSEEVRIDILSEALAKLGGADEK